jgi:hypothetical protein
MALLRPESSSIYIKGKACTPVGSNYYYIDFVSFSFCAASRSKTLVEAATEVLSRSNGQDNLPAQRCFTYLKQ